MKVINLFLGCISIIVLFSGNAFAHKVNIFAYAENGMVYTESYFNDGKEVVNSKIEVFESKDNKLLLTGETDDSGKFSFNIPGPTGLIIVLSASMGHKNEYTLSEDEVREALGIVKNSAEPAVRPERETKTSKPAVETNNISQKELEKFVERIVEKKTGPIMKKLVKIEEQIGKPSIQDIISGIGYILGLMGISIYFKTRHAS